MGPEFEAEQQHLSETYAKLQAIEAQLEANIEKTEREASQDKNDMSSELAIDYASDDMAMETYAELEAMNRIIDNYSRSKQMADDKMKQVRFLLQQPYFAKVQLQFKPGSPARDIYLGAAGMVDESRRHFIVDWRSPVAETYYNQENGETSYVADGRTIKCNLKLRRQFDLHQSTLRNYFDTTVAIEDPLLLASLASDRTNKLGNITATIQKEQNRIIRHEDVPALLVAGIAGSGKTSVLLQRIAYLFYTLRDSLRPGEVYLLSPNPVFRSYIDDVLPNMGESNPHCITWTQLLEEMGLGGRPEGSPGLEMLERIDRAVWAGMSFRDGDFCDLKVGKERVIGAEQVRKAVAKLRNCEPGPRLAGLMEEDLLERLEQRIKRRAGHESVQDAIVNMELDEQLRVFGEFVQPASDAEFEHYGRIYLRDLYQPVVQQIQRADWLNVNRIGQRLLGEANLSACEWLYLKMALTGCGNREARYVMIDEVQDYSQAQLATIARWFKNAHFMLLGDENQAIREGTATFAQVEGIFGERCGAISCCELLTSYRCTPQITAEFCKLMDAESRIQVQSVQREGAEVQIREFDCQEAWLDALGDLIAQQNGRVGLCAVVCADMRRAKWLRKQLGHSAPALLGAGDTLPAGGAVIIPLKLAKGLEFDRVIIPDAQAESYPESNLSRRRLYTAISRATKELSILSLGPLSPLLR